MKVRVESYSCRSIVVGREPDTGVPVRDTVANLEIARMIEDGWRVVSSVLSIREDRHDPSHGYRHMPGHINVPDVVTRTPRVTVLFERDE